MGEAAASFGPRGTILEQLAVRWAPERPLPLVIPEPPGAERRAAELARWTALFARYELELADPGEAELRAPGDLPAWAELLEGGTGPSAVADLFGLLAAATVVAQRDDLAFLASTAGTASGHAPVFVFHPEDWGVHPSDPGLGLALFRLEETAGQSAHPFGSGARPGVGPAERALRDRYLAEHPAERLPAHLDPHRLARRSDWLVRALLGLPLQRSLESAAPLDAFATERGLCGQHEHLALYWMATGALLGRPEVFEAARAAGRDFPRAAALGRGLEAWRRREPTGLGPLDPPTLDALADELPRLAPPAVRGARLEPASGPSPRAALEARGDPEDDDFLALLDHLASGREPGPGPWRDVPEAGLEAALADRARPRHRALLEHDLRANARVSAHHPHAGRGRILALGRFCTSPAELDRALAAAGGTERFGPRRHDEVWRAIAALPGPEATARLAEGAARFAREAGEWIRTASRVPFDALLERDGLPTHALIAAFCARAPLTMVSAPLWAQVAAAAARHRVVRAVPGLRRAVTARLGRIDDGTRADLVRALAELDPDAGPFLAATARWLEAERAAESDPDAARGRSLDLACVLGPALALVDRPELVAAAAGLLAGLAPELGSPRGPRAETLEALAALLDGIAEREPRALLGPARALAAVRFRVRPAHAAAARRFRAAATRLER